MNHNSRCFSPDISDDKVLGDIVLGEEEEGRHWETFQFSVNIKFSYTKKRKKKDKLQKKILSSMRGHKSSR